MSTLSVCVIAKNEEKFLEESLSSISPVADEIIFVDTGSDDKTVEIAKKFTSAVLGLFSMIAGLVGILFSAKRPTKHN